MTELALFNKKIWDHGAEVVGKGIGYALHLLSCEENSENSEMVEEVGKKLLDEFSFCEVSHLNEKYSDILKKE